MVDLLSKTSKYSETMFCLINITKYIDHMKDIETFVKKTHMEDIYSYVNRTWQCFNIIISCKYIYTVKQDIDTITKLSHIEQGIRQIVKSKKHKVKL